MLLVECELCMLPGSILVSLDLNRHAYTEPLERIVAAKAIPCRQTIAQASNLVHESIKNIVKSKLWPQAEADPTEERVEPLAEASNPTSFYCGLFNEQCQFV
eukprot:647779-Amphidinium_carterae.2